MDENNKTQIEAKERVLKTLGQCVLSLQRYELVLKGLLGQRLLNTRIRSLSAPATFEIPKASSNKTLGMLVGELTSEFFQPPGTEEPFKDEPFGLHPDEGRITLKFSRQLPPERLESLTKELKKLVETRNEIAHHFLERFDLDTNEGLLKAQNYLTTVLLSVDNHLQDLKSWCVSLDESRQLLASFFSSDAFEEHLKAL
jgi:hypothetical protein